MNYSRDTISHGTTGVKTMTCGFQPVEAELDVTPGPGTTFTTIYKSKGTTDGTNQVCDTNGSSGSNHFQRRYTDRMISISEWNGSTWNETFKITFDSYTSTEFKYNVVTANANYQVHRKVRG